MLAAKYSPVTLRNMITRIRVVFNHGVEAGLIEAPDYGPDFRRPSAKVLRRERNTAGEKLFTREEILRILVASKPAMKAMIFLAANGGLGNSDIGLLPLSAIDFETGFLDYPRPKTEVQRRIPLWNETLSAIQEYLEIRPKPRLKEDETILFITEK
jgi:integrase